MDAIKKYGKVILGGIVLLSILTVAFYIGGSAPGLQGFTPPPSADMTKTPPPIDTLPTLSTLPGEKDSLQQGQEPSEEIGQEPSEEIGQEPSEEAVRDTPKEAPILVEAPTEVAPKEEIPVLEEAEEEAKAQVATLSISCATVLTNLDWLDEGKAELLPADGQILNSISLELKEGESVFDLLLRACQSQKIHMEYENTPLYQAAYIEGIANLYEFDCGELSGWMYRVNGSFPHYGASRYTVQAGDVIEWVYTCDLGVDVGGSVEAGQAQHGT